MRTAIALLLCLAVGAMAHDICGTPDLDDDVTDAVELVMARFKSAVCSSSAANVVPMCGAKVRAPFVIPLAWKILYDPETGEGSNITDDQIALQVDIMNQDYAGRSGLGFNTNWRFRTASIERIGNARWFSNMIGLESFFKEELANNTETTLHIYTGNMNGGVLGMCYFSFMYLPSSYMHGCLVNHQAMVNGGATPYDSGQTAVHEVGHHLGLYHVWQAKCSERSDRVEDTPPQVTNSRGCPDPIPQSCQEGLFDNIHNHMDYSDDDCRYLFTAGQSARTDEVITTFHPGYLSDSVRGAISKALPDAWKEPLAFARLMGHKAPFLRKLF